MYEGPDSLFFLEMHNSGNSGASVAAVDLTHSVGARGMHYGPYFSSKDNYEPDMSNHSDRLAEQMGAPGPAPYLTLIHI